MSVVGTIHHEPDRRKWVVRCAPHVAMRIRRLFHGSDRGKNNEAIISSTDAAAFDLETMVRTRWDLELDASAATTFPAAVERYRARQAAVEAILRPDYQPPLPTPLALPLREYQQTAVDLIARSGSVLVADDVGLGKTALSIGAIVAAGVFPAVIVTMTHLCRQWRKELGKFAPHLSSHVITKGEPYPLRDLVVTTYDTATKRRRVVKQGAMKLPDVLVLNYHKLAGWADELIHLGVRFVVYDEVQELRRDSSHRYRAARALSESAQFRCGLSATPILNYGSEIFNVVDCIAPGQLGAQGEFLAEWCSRVWGQEEKKAKVKDPPALRAFLTETGTMIRRTRRDVGRELPPLQRIWHVVDADERALDAVEDAAGELARFLLARTGTRMERMKAAGDLDWKLRQATGLAKAPAVADFVRMLVDSGESVVLAGWHHGVYDVWRSRLADLEPAIYTGEVSEAGKAEAIRRFVEGETKVLILSLRAGQGIDGLQHICRTVVFGELDWSPGIHIQFEGRVSRDGQRDPVVAYYLVADDGSDPVIRDVLGIKEEQRVGLTEKDASNALGQTSQSDDDDRMRKLAESYLARRRRQ